MANSLKKLLSLFLLGALLSLTPQTLYGLDATPYYDSDDHAGTTAYDDSDDANSAPEVPTENPTTDDAAPPAPEINRHQGYGYDVGEMMRRREAARRLSREFFAHDMGADLEETMRELAAPVTIDPLQEDRADIRRHQARRVQTQEDFRRTVEQMQAQMRRRQAARIERLQRQLNVRPREPQVNHELDDQLITREEQDELNMQRSVAHLKRFKYTPAWYLISSLVNAFEISALTSKDPSNIRRNAKIATLGSAIEILKTISKGAFLPRLSIARSLPWFADSLIAGGAIGEKIRRHNKADLIAKNIDKLPKEVRASIDRDQKIQFALLALQTMCGVGGELKNKTRTTAPFAFLISAIRNIHLNLTYRKIERAVQAQKESGKTTVSSLMRDYNNKNKYYDDHVYVADEKENMLKFIQEKISKLKPGEKLEQQYITYLENLKRSQEEEYEKK